MNLSVWIVVVMILFSSVNASAEGWSGATSVKVIYPQSDTSIVYISFDAMPNSDSCAYGATWVALQKSNGMFSEIYSMVLTARTANLPVNYYMRGCNSGGFPILIHMRLEQNE